MDHDGEEPNDINELIDGNQNQDPEPDDRYHCLSSDVLRRIKRNDPGVFDLIIDHGFWARGAGRAVGDNNVIQYLSVDCSLGTRNTNWVREIFQGLSRNRSIYRLSLMNYDSDVDMFHFLTPFFQHNRNLRSLQVSAFHEGQPLHSLSLALSKCKDSQLEHIFIETVATNDEQVGLFFDSLKQISSLLTICFRNSFIGKVGCKSFAKLLNNPSAKIENIELGCNSIDDECASILSKALSRTKSLREVTVLSDSFLYEDDGITTFQTVAGWRDFVTIIAHPMCLIEHLYLTDAAIGNEVAIILGNALAVNKSIKLLHLGRDNWGISGCTINEEGAVVIASALADNTTLEQLRMPINGGTDRFYDVLSNVLWDKSSIDNTFNSNHTLCKLVLYLSEGIHPSNAIEQLVEMNQNENKSEVAHQKILQHHFLEGNANMHAFARLPETSMPVALEWIGRNRDGRTLMYNFAQEFPTLFDITLSGRYFV